MKLMIDNLQGLGALDYTAWIDATVAARIERTLNEPGRLCFSLAADESGFVLPLSEARVTLAKENGELLFTGYLNESPAREYLGWGEKGPVYRYDLVAESDEVLLDQKALPNRAPFVARSAGSALRQLAVDLLPGGFDTSAVEDVDILTSYRVNTQKKFSAHAGEIAVAARASYRAMNDALVFTPVGKATYDIRESDAAFSPSRLKLTRPGCAVNDVTVIGLEEPQAYVRDYFVGDGLSLRFYLSQTPFQQSRGAFINEKYQDATLDPATWVVSDPQSAVSVAAQTLEVNGGTGQSGETSVSFVEQIEMGGAIKLQHGDVNFSSASRGVIGGLYAGGVSASCLAGFQITPNGSKSNIQAVVNGSVTGPVVTTTAGHRYVFTTYLYSMEVYRSGETYHSAVHPAGDGLGGATKPADVRIVLEVQEINPADPHTLVAPATVLYDDVMTNIADYCTYALVNAASMYCSIAYTYAAHISLAEIRTALPNSPYVTQLVGSLSDGGECRIASSTTLDFYPQYVPPLNTLIVASYRGSGRAVAEVVNPESIASISNEIDDGVRGIVRVMESPSARTEEDCENAALAILDHAADEAWGGSYETWSDFLPGQATDIFPGDAVSVDVPSQAAAFTAIVRKVNIEVVDPANDRGLYNIEFANDSAQPLSYQDSASGTGISLQDAAARLTNDQVGNYYLPSLTSAQVTQVTSTTVLVDLGISPANGCGVEVRPHDFGWGAANDRNLVGRFNTRTFNLARLARTQTYFLRLYDASSPARYSRYAAALHVDYPL